MTRKQAAFVAGVTLIAGFAFGVTRSETRTETVTVTETVQNEVAPAACVRALDLSAEGFQRVGELLRGVSTLNFVARTNEFQAWAERTAPEISDASGACRAAS